MNTAQGTYRVHHCGHYWVVGHGDRIYTIVKPADLVSVLRGQLPPHILSVEEKFHPKTETVAEFLARGGTIQHVGRPANEPPKPLPEAAPPKPDPKKLTLAMLGFHIGVPKQ